MALSNDFERELNKLFSQRTRWLVQTIGISKKGKPPRFDRSKVDRGIEKLQQIASKAFAKKHAVAEFKQFAE